MYAEHSEPDDTTGPPCRRTSRPSSSPNPRTAEVDKILRRCVHCGFCTATCPTYVLLGDERDSPRGRIYLIKDMFERERPAAARGAAPRRPLPVLPVLHDDLPERRRLHAPGRPRPRPHRGDRRAAASRIASLRDLLAPSCPIPSASAWRSGPRASRALRGLLRRLGLKELAAMLELAPAGCCAGADFTGPGTAATKDRAARARDPAGRLRPAGAAAGDQRRHHPPAGAPRRRRGGRAGRGLLRRAGASHGPRGRGDRDAPRRNIDAWTKLMDKGPLDAIIINASGCGTTVKDYGHMLARRPGLRRARRQASRRWRATSRSSSAELEHGPARALVVAPRRLSLGLLHAARPAHRRRAAQAAAQRRLHGGRGAGGPSVLRLGRHLQHPAAGDRRASCATARSPTSKRARPTGGDRQHRLHHPARRRHGHSRSSTPWSCSTGPTAAPCRAASRSSPGTSRTCPRPSR